jgi:hypothetical protein
VEMENCCWFRLLVVHFFFEIVGTNWFLTPKQSKKIKWNETVNGILLAWVNVYSELFNVHALIH